MNRYLNCFSFHIQCRSCPSIATEPQRCGSTYAIIDIVKSNLYRERRKRLPPMSQSRAEVTLTGDWANTLGGQPFVLAESGAEDKIILLGAQSNLHHLAEAECLYVDGTLKHVHVYFIRSFPSTSSSTVRPSPWCMPCFPTSSRAHTIVCS